MFLLRPNAQSVLVILLNRLPHSSLLFESFFERCIVLFESKNVSFHKRMYHFISEYFISSSNISIHKRMLYVSFHNRIFHFIIGYFNNHCIDRFHPSESSSAILRIAMYLSKASRESQLRQHVALQLRNHQPAL